MFDYVPRKALDAEHDLRMKAEAAADEARQVAARAFALVESERIAHRAEMADLLDRTLPKPKDPVPGFGVVGGPSHLSYEEIMAIPAVGRRGVRERNAAARDAKAREELEDKNGDASSRRAVLSPEEQQQLDQQLPQ